ncbi:MAG TPA: zinc dependent phospholipase C family protein [Terriglobales bacterium]|nr:zinc dependent phospholipase C family protein [Terriglobales bacterium]
MNVRRIRATSLLALVLVTALAVPPSYAYSVFTHEQLVDLAWAASIRPLLLARFPGTTEAQLREAHAYAYGGCLIQDIGYYPFGKDLFSDLTHYVRSGDFVMALFRDARNVDEYAFAIGALSHYLGDSIGHFQAINPATAVAFPNLEREFGPSVTYDESPHGHVRTEFGFDIGQLSKHQFAPPAYMQHLGFLVARRLLERAFRETYGIDVHGIFGRARPALRSYRSSARSFIPEIAEAEVLLHARQFLPDEDDPAYRLFNQRLARVDFERQKRFSYEKPSFKTHLLAFVIRIVPKIGPLSLLAIKIPDRKTEEWYLESVNRTIDRYREMLDELRASPKKELALANRDLDTGDGVKPGRYRRTDTTYAKLLDRLAKTPEASISAELRRNILDFYSDPTSPIATKKNAREWKKINVELEKLRAMKAVELAEIPTIAGEDDMR